MRNYRRIAAPVKENPLQRPSEGAQRAMAERARVVVKTYANNEIRISFAYGGDMPPRKGAPAAVMETAEPATVALDYNHKVQMLAGANSEERRKRPEKITRYGKHTIREGCGVLAQKYGKELAFLTLTLPGDTPEAIEVFAANSKPLLNGFLQKYRNSVNTITYMYGNFRNEALCICICALRYQPHKRGNRLKRSTAGGGAIFWRPTATRLALICLKT